MAILVTGGAGYIGSHTCVALLNAGQDIIVVDNFSNSKPEVLKRIEAITGKSFISYKCNIADKVCMTEIFKAHAIESVIHFAGSKAVGESVANPLMYYDNNVVATIKLCELMNEFGVKRMVFSSSATVYGDPASVPIYEHFETGAFNPYGRTKQMIEEILMDLSRSDSEWSVALLRYFNPIGAHESGTIGEDPNGIPNNLMPYITQVAIGKRPLVNVFGGDYDTVDGTGVRDYIHVVDLADGHLKALDYLEQHVGVHVYNLGTGTGYSVLEMIHAVEKASGVKIPYEIVGRRPGDIASCYANPEKAQMELHWTAKKTLADMCQDAWRWQKQNPEGYGLK